MNNEAAHSLGFYINVKRLNGISKLECLGADDYTTFLSDLVIDPTQAAYAGFGKDCPLIPLQEISLSSIQYADIVDQIYDGVHFMAVSLQIPPPAPIPTSTKTDYFGNYIATLNNDMRTRDDVEAIINRINGMLAERDQNNQRINGLVVGRVQSGKTRNYIGLMLKAIDQGWNVFVVLTSANTALAEQTRKRIEHDLAEARAFGGHPLRFDAPQTGRRAVPLPVPNAIQNKSGGHFYWGVAMKETSNLDNVLSWLGDNKSLTSIMRILVIDDESDNATPDAHSGRDQLLDEGEIDDLAAVIRDEDSYNFSDLADWIESAQENIDEVMRNIESDPGCKNDDIVKQLKKELNDTCPIAKRLNNILQKDKFLDVLDLQPHPSDDDGHQINVPYEIGRYFVSPNGRGYRTKKMFLKLLKTFLNLAAQRSAISDRICKLIDKVPGSNSWSFDFKSCAYIAYTATPYANILNERPDETPLYADFIASLMISPRYFGLDRIFGTNLKKLEPRMPIVNEVSNTDVRFPLRSLQGVKDREITPPEVLKVEFDDNLEYVCNDPAYIGNWDSLKNAVKWAFCTAGARSWFRREKYVPKINARDNLTDEEKKQKINDIAVRWTTMLVNISQKQESHARQLELVRKFIGKRLSSPAERDSFSLECSTLWSAMTEQFRKSDFDSLFNSTGGLDDYGTIEEVPSWNDIKADVRSFIDASPFEQQTHLIVINSANAENRDKQDFYNQVGNHANELAGDHLWIVFGGNTISRGLTLSGLTVSYFDRIRKSVAVDTFTQMGRWFGYRTDYELLPRLWMSRETIGEFKKTAVVENRLHESIRENFDAGFSPRDPAHYQQIFCWGRRLSGRVHAQSAMSRNVGTMCTTDDVSLRQSSLDAVYESALALIDHKLGPQFVRSPQDYRIYNNFPLWRNIDCRKVRNYIDGIAKYYPERSRLVLKALVAEIDRENPISWDVVIGEPATNNGREYDMHVNKPIPSGNPHSVRIDGDVAHYVSVRSDMPFYSMIETNVITRVDVEYLRKNFDEVVEKLESRAARYNGALPPAVENALAPYHGADVKERLTALLNAVNADPARTPLPSSIHTLLPEGYSNRSAADYRERVHDEAGHVNPVLQIYLVTPPAGRDSSQSPVIIHAFYWPDHSPIEFHSVAVGLPPARESRPRNADFYRTVADVLRENGFPMSADNGLREAVIHRLQNCDEAHFDKTLPTVSDEGPYAKVPGTRNAWYERSWADDPVEKIRQFVRGKAMEILEDHEPHEREDIFNQIIAENPRLQGVFAATNSEKNDVLSPSFVAANGIIEICRRPITYKLP